MKTEELREIKSRVNTDEYIEEYAREKFLYSKDGELIIDLTDDKED